MKTHLTRKPRLSLITLLVFASWVQAAPTELSNSPLSGASSVEINPNVLFILDDSTSMKEEQMPDWAKNRPLWQEKNPKFNGIYYNPSITYTAPKYFTAGGAADTTTYPSQTSTATAGWTQVKDDGYGVQSSALVGLAGFAHYYTTVVGEYCTNKSLKSCVAATSPSATYPEPAPLRWCSSAAEAGAASPTAGACQATQIQSTGTNIPFEYPRFPHPRISTFTVSGASSTSVSGITVNGQQILAASVAATTSAATLAAGIADQINACTLGLSGACQQVGFRAEVSGASVTIFAPSAITHTPVVTKSGTMTLTPTAFAKPGSNQAPGEIVMTVITDPSSTYSKNANRADCAGATTCTYAEEMTNYANWYAYYRTRMQMMKTASSTAFEPIGSSFRVGLMSINNNAGSDFLNVTNFDATQKKAWYDKLFAAKIEPSPGVIAQTPLRVALSDAGRLYANKLGATFRGISVVDPVQHYCQQNVSILSTDGYWNQGAGYTVAGVGNPVGNQDGPEVVPAVLRPQLDAGGPQDQLLTLQDRKMLTPTTATWLQKKTEQVQKRNALVERRDFNVTETRTSTLQEKNAQWQKRERKLQTRSNTVPLTSTLTQIQTQTQPLQIRTGPLQSRTGQLQTRTKTQTQEKVSLLQYQSGQRQSKTYQLQRRYTTQVQQRTSSNGGASWSGWSNVDTCTTVSSGTNRVQCQTASGPGSWSDVSSCSVVAYGSVTSGGSDGGSTTYTTGYECQYTNPSWVNTASCSTVAKSTSSPYTVGTAVDCQTVWSGTWVNATSTCTTGEAMQCQYTAWPGSWSNVATCTTQTQSAASPYTVLTARQCQANQWTPWADTASTCNSSTTVGCQYTWTGWSNDGTCSVNPASTGNPYSVITPKECQVAWSSWANTAANGTCTTNLTGASQTDCRYSGTWSAWSNVASCTANPVSAGPAYSGWARNCQTVWTTPADVGPCVPNATTSCTSTWSAWADVVAPGGCTATSTGGAGGTGAVECQYRDLASWYNVASCLPELPESTHPNYTVNVAHYCQVTWPTGWVNATATCVKAVDKDCQYTNWTGWTPAGSCTAQPRSGGPTSFSVLTARECQTNWSSWSTVASCTGSAGVTECRTTWPNPWVGNGSTSCTPTASMECRTQTTSDWGPALPNNTNNDPPLTSSGIACSAGTVGDVITSCRNEVPPPTGWLAAPSCEPGSYVDANGNTIDKTCKLWTNGVPDNDGAAPVDVATCTEDPGTTSPYIRKLCTVRARGQTPDTLADVAQYYWKTDLRTTGLGNCTGGPVTSGGITTNNNVCTNDTTYDRQYMTTYTLGLGASGLMQYQSDYQTAGSGDFYSVKTGATADSATGVCSWQKNGVCNWPMPAADSQANIDDLWHAAVNGRGSYFSAADPSSVAAGISSALAAITVKEGALTAVTVTSPNLVAGDNGVFELSFKAGEWSGDLVKRTVDGATGALSATATWSAKGLLDAKISGTGHTSRKIFTFNPGGESASGLGDNLKPFLWANLTTAEQDFFLKPAINSLSQFCTIGTTCLSAANQTNASGENLVNFLRGDKSNEGPQADLAKFYRQRVHALGDIVGSEAVYVQQSPWQYADYKYFDFKASNSSRTGMVYVGANDGMLHAFNSTTGQEVWAYVPKIVLPNLYQLADKGYAGPGFHRFFVDGTPVMGDVCTSACTTPDSGSGSPVWKTILVGGLNKGGRGYYALDVTDPAAPKALWEFTDDNLGYSYGNPVITKIENPNYPSSSTDKEIWVVVFSSGYNNYGPGDGVGRLFILNANTGALIRSISTGVGDTTTPSGLGRITAWANYPNYNNFAKRVYGGDLLGNLWRFDVNGDIPTEVDPPVYDAQRLATLKDANGAVQPITSRPEIGKVKDYPVVFVATGQLLGGGDLSTTQRQSIYAIKDRLINEDYGSPRPQTPAQTSPTPGQFVNQTPTNTTLLGAPLLCSNDDADATDGDGGYCVEGEGIVKSTANTVDFNTKDGWYMDFPVAGERVNTDLRLVQGTLAFNTNTPQSGACVPVGVSYAYFLDYRTGGYVEGSNGLIGVRLGSYLASAPSIIRLEDGTIKELVRTDSATTLVKEVPTAPTLFSTRRISWRELITGQ